MRPLLLVLLLVGCATARDASPLLYPAAPRGDVVDTLHGVAVPDPYRPLEDVDAPATKAWVDAENALTQRWLDEIPERPALRDRLTSLWDYERWGVPRREGGRLFVAKNDGLQNQAVLFVIDSDGAAPRMLLDPNTLSTDGTVALADWTPSRDGKLLAYSLAVAGSDWKTIHVRDVATGTDLPDVVEWHKFGGASWAPDASGFWYTRYDAPAAGAALVKENYFQKLCFHRVGDAQAKDAVVFERPQEKKWGFGAAATEDGRYVVVEVSAGTGRKNAVHWALCEDARHGLSMDGGGPHAPMLRPLVPGFDAGFDFVGSDGGVFWFSTDKDAPKGRVVAIDLAHPEPASWKTVVPEADESLASVDLVGDHFLCSYLKDAHSVVRSYALDGRFEREVALPGLGSARGFGGRRADRETYFSFTSFTTPSSVWRYDVDTGATSVFREAKTPFDGSRFVTEQVFYESKDGTRVPMFLTHRRDVDRDGANPTFLYGYGGFGISQTPSFSPATALWLEMGGVHAVANLRGGGEYGKAWHEAGTKANKQNVFDDFIAAAERLVADGWTSPAKLAIAGGSNGGLLVGACEVQRPDLFGACLPAVGVMDMLRFHKFTIGWAWQSDYGSPDDPKDFETLRRYSPYHNLKPARYPPTLVTTADHDDRVVPGHSFKFAAALQSAQQGAAPVLIRVQTKAGHGAGKPTKKIVEEAADAAAFLVRALEIDLPDGFGR
jgi:prolyl oligopeptidase